MSFDFFVENWTCEDYNVVTVELLPQSGLVLTVEGCSSIFSDFLHFIFAETVLFADYGHMSLLLGLCPAGVSMMSLNATS